MTRLSARNQETTRRGGSTTLAAVIGAWTLAATLSSAIWGLEPSHTLDQYVSRSWGLESGMPQLTVNAIVQTPDHYLWIGTFGGLARFDGVRFEIFGLEQGLESLRILSLMVDREGTLWVGTEDAGVARLSPGSRHFVHHESIPLTPVWALAEDPNGGVWIGTSDGLLHSDGQSARPFAPSGSPPLTDISSLSIDGRGRLWVGARGDGLAVLDGDTLHTIPLPQAAQWVLALTVSDDGDLWAYTGAGLIHIENDSAQQVSRHDDSRAPKAAILADDGGSLWFGGLELSRWAGGETTPAQGDLAGTTIRALFQDIEGTLWVGTDRRGLYQLSDGPLTTYSTTEGIVGRAVLPVTEGPDGAIWVGTRCGGLSRFDGRRFQPVLYDEQTPENCVHSLLTASDGTLWISDSQGLAALRGETLTRYGREQGLPVGSPRALMEDGAGRLWIGTWSGLYRLEGGRFTRFGSADGLADERVLFITEDDAGALWIGSDSGLSRFQNGVFTAYDQASGLPPGAVRAILATGDEVWIGTYGGGLARLEDGVFTRYTTADGLYDEAISSILADGEGHLWLCGNRGLFNVSRIELEAFARGEISRIRSIAFGASDGMKSPECNGGGQPSGWKSSDGRLWFATIHGVSVVNPGEPWSPQIPPTVIGEEIVTGGRRLFPEGGITVGPGRDLEVHYTGISLAAPERVTFRYRLDGFDADWIEVGSRRAAYYTNLPGGRYRFEVEAGFDGHRWGSQPFRVDVHVQPRFFETPLFVGLAVLLVVLTFLAAHRLRIRHLKARDAELSALAARG